MPVVIQVRTVCLLVNCELVNITICETLTMPAVLYGGETLFLILREERRLGIFENRMLRRIF
jgi:hypothetical protein